MNILERLRRTNEQEALSFANVASALQQSVNRVYTTDLFKPFIYANLTHPELPQYTMNIGKNAIPLFQVPKPLQLLCTAEIALNQNQKQQHQVSDYQFILGIDTDRKDSQASYLRIKRFGIKDHTPESFQQLTFITDGEQIILENTLSNGHVVVEPTKVIVHQNGKIDSRQGEIEQEVSAEVFPTFLRATKAATEFLEQSVK